MDTTREGGRSLVNCETVLNHDMSQIASPQAVEILIPSALEQSGTAQGSWVTPVCWTNVSTFSHARAHKGLRTSHSHVELQS